MKTNRFLQMVAGIAMFAGVWCLTSCEKETFELPEVIESEVTDEGVSSEISEETTDSGTVFRYESWINVKGTTRAAFDDKVSVMLNGSYANVVDQFDVDTWELPEPVVTVTREGALDYTEGFVSVSDSVLIYKVDLGIFDFSYRLEYETAVYDDKVTRKTMPYYYYSNIKDLGGKLEVQDSYVDNGIAYARRVYLHSLSVDYGGKTHVLKALIILRRELGPSNVPYIVRSEVVDKTIANAIGGGECLYVSSIKVKSLMSRGSTEEKTYSAALTAFSEQASYVKVTFEGKPSDVKFESFTVTENGDGYDPSENFIYYERVRAECVVHFNGFSLSIPFVRYRALFDNIVLREKMKDFPYSAETSKVKSMEWKYVESRGNEHIYRLDLIVELGIGNRTVEGSYSGEVIFLYDE